MKIINVELHVLCEGSAGEWVEVYECFNTFDAKRIMDRLETNPSVIKMWITETLV